MSCSGERCCTIRQHRSGGGLLSPRGSRGLKCWGVSFGSCRLRDLRNARKPSLVAGDSQRQGCAVSLVAVAALRRSSSQFLFARCLARLCGSVCQNSQCSSWQCMCRILGIPVTLCDEMAKATATLPLALGGMGLAKRRQVACCCPLGELGRHVAHDSGTDTQLWAELIVGHKS